jgi:predicted amidohydrolase YtcJ
MAKTPEHGDEHATTKQNEPGQPRPGVSRRNVIIGGGTAVAAAALGPGLAGSAAVASAPAYTASRVDDSLGDLLLVNGKIHTMDDGNSVVSAVRIKDGLFTAVGQDALRAGGQARRLDLGGRTVIPGIVESHTHFVSLANRVGYHVAQWELAPNIAGVLEYLAARRPDVPEGQFITAMGAGGVNKYAENRLPTQAELDEAVPDRPVFLLQSGTGPGQLNTLGQEFFESITATDFPVLVQAGGVLANVGGVNHANRALYHLRLRQTFEDKVRSALDAQAYSASVGTTTVLDQTLPPPNTVDPTTGLINLALLEPQPTHGLANLNHYRMYDGWLAAHRDGRHFIRLQMNFLHNQGYIPGLGPIERLEDQLPELRERLRNQFPFFGDEWVRTGGIGEWAAPFTLQTANPNGYLIWREAQRLVAHARWRNENAQAGSKTNPANIDQVCAVYEECDADFGIKNLRWGLQHADFATEDQLARLKALNVAISVSGHRWLSGTPSNDGLPNGTMFNRIKASGIRWALHQDGVHIATHNPWFALHYAITGLNAAGVDINAGQHLTRQEALNAYTRGASWYLNRENDLGSIEPGKFADVVVLDKDYFTVSDAEVRTIRPVLTIVNGDVVHDTGVVNVRGN